jgi:hypothetical protein
MTRCEAGSQKQRQHEHACSDAGNATPQLGQLRLGRPAYLISRKLAGKGYKFVDTPRATQ